MLHKVKKVEWLSEYKLKLQFSNGKIKIVDFSHEIKKAKNLFLDLVDIDYFKKVKCDGYSICWPNGIDYCPDVLYNMKEVQQAKRLARKRKAYKIKKSAKSNIRIRKKSKT